MVMGERGMGVMGAVSYANGGRVWCVRLSVSAS
jgi:hypothetical protein